MGLRTGGFRVPDGHHFHELQARRIRVANSIWVSPDMSDLVASTAKLLPNRDVPPFPPAGIAYFANPIWLRVSVSLVGVEEYDLGSPTVEADVPIRVLDWLPGTVETYLRRDDLSEEQWEKAFPNHPQAQSEEWWLASFPLQANNEGYEREWAIARSLWALSAQRVGVHRAEAPSRPARRRAERAGIPPDVSVVDLRRPVGAAVTGGSSRDWSHRWLVGGHWRNQWLASTKTHRLTWINPYVKGPTDKPFVPKERVYRLVR